MPKIIPDDPAVLKKMIAVLQAENAKISATLRVHDQLVLALRLRIAKLQKLAFGKSSEKIEREIEQLELALEDLLVAVAEADDAPIDEGQSLRDRSVTMTLMIDPFAPFPRQLYPDLQQLMRPNTAAVGCKVVAVSTRTDVHAA